MANFKWSPGCQCCACTIAEDTFDRADSTNLGSDWTEQTGDSEIESNRLVLPADAIATFTPSGGYYAMEVVAQGDSGDKPRLIYYRNSSNWLAAELEIGTSGKARIIQRISGTTTTTAECDYSSSANTDYTLYLCHTAVNSNFNTFYETGEVTLYSVATLFIDCSPVVRGQFDSLVHNIVSESGVATGGTAVDVQFDNFKSLDFNTDTCALCDECPWPFSDGTEVYSTGDDAARPDLKITVPTMTNGTCSTCGDYDGEWTTTYDDFCIWTLNASPTTTCEGINHILIWEVAILRVSATSIRIRCRMHGDTGSVEVTHAEWSKDYGVTELCSESDKTLDLQSNDAYCNYPSTVTISVV